MKKKTKTILKVVWRLIDHIAAAIYALFVLFFLFYIIPSNISLYWDYVKLGWKCFCTTGIWMFILVLTPICFYYLKDKIDNWANK